MGSLALTSRITHVAMVFLTFVNLLWIQPPSCCCANPIQGAAGKSTCCAAKSSGSGCNCCCQQSAEDETDASCPHCAAKKNSTCCVPSKVTGKTPCSTGECNCGTNSARPTAPITSSTSTNPSLDVEVPLFALVELRLPDQLLVEDFERHNREISALDPPVSIRFGVWRN